MRGFQRFGKNGEIIFCKAPFNQSDPRFKENKNDGPAPGNFYFDDHKGE